MRWGGKEAVLCTAFVCALVSMLFVPPDAEYRGYVNLQVLCLLFCLFCRLSFSLIKDIVVFLKKRYNEGERTA